MHLREWEADFYLEMEGDKQRGGEKKEEKKEWNHIKGRHSHRGGEEGVVLWIRRQQMKRRFPPPSLTIPLSVCRDLTRIIRINSYVMWYVGD